MRLPTGLTGTAGEYYVAAEPSRRGWLATVTIKNAPGTDVLAQNLVTKRTVAIQTKTSSGGRSFSLHPRDALTYDPDPGWMILVGLGSLEERPTFFVIPRCHLATTPHKDSTRLAMTRDAFVGYQDGWDLLTDAPDRLRT